MKDDRDLINLARTKRKAEQFAHRLNASLLQVFKGAKRLGINLGPQPPRFNGRFKTKSK